MPRSAHPVRVQQLRSGELTFEVAGCGDGAQLILCLHGYLEHAISFRHQLPALAAAGYRAWAPNLRGYGRSMRPGRTCDYRLEVLLDDIDALLDFAGADRAILLGHDWGGNLAWHYAATRPERVSGLVVSCCPHPAAFERALSHIGQAVRSAYVPALLNPGWAETCLARGGPYSCLTHGESNLPDAVRQVYLDNLAAPGAITAMTHYYRAYVLDPGLPERLSFLRSNPITAPTLVVSAGEDAVLSTDAYVSTGQFVPSLQHWHYPVSHHWPNQQHPRAFNEMLCKWLTDRHAS